MSVGVRDKDTGQTEGKDGKCPKRDRETVLTAAKLQGPKGEHKCHLVVEHN